MGSIFYAWDNENILPTMFESNPAVKEKISYLFRDFLTSAKEKRTIWTAVR